MPAPLRLAVLLSGSGTTLQNLIDRIGAGRLPAQIVGVIASRPDVLGAQRARAAGLPLEIVERRTTGDSPPRPFPDRPADLSWPGEVTLLTGPESPSAPRLANRLAATRRRLHPVFVAPSLARALKPRPWWKR